MSRVGLGYFVVDIVSGELWSAGAEGGRERIVLREQPLRVLRLLIEYDGRVATREEIKKKLWPNDTIVDFDHSINVAIGTLRRALGDSAFERMLEIGGRLAGGEAPSGGICGQTKELVAGYWVWQVRSMEEAVEWAKRCPNPMPGPSDLEIRPFWEPEDFDPEIVAQVNAHREMIANKGK